MSKVISVNCGSSSLKFQLFNMPSEEVLTSGIAECIGLEKGGKFVIKVNGEKIVKEVDLKDHKVAVGILLNLLEELGVVGTLDEINAAGHRVVQGASKFKGSVLVDEESIAAVEEFSELAPLHNPANLVGYYAFKEALPNIKHTFVFDTAFHQTMPEDSYIYPVPYSWYQDHKVRRYGAHGTSHLYVSHRTIELMGLENKPSKIITLHLGNGASICAVKDGLSVNTSMGFTPLAGVMMGTRSGNIDPAIIPYMGAKLNKSAQEIIDILNKESGMLGVSGMSSDARVIEEAALNGEERAILTHKVYVNSIINIIGGYAMQMGGVDAITFTAGLGENDTLIREKILKACEEFLGLELDYELNSKTRGKEVKLSKDNSKVAVYIVPTDEEVMIARDTFRLINE